MTYIYTPYIWPFIATIIMNLFMIFYVLKDPHRKGVIAFSLTMVFCSLWCVETVMVYSATTLETKNFWAKAGFPTHTFGALAWLIMILQLTNQVQWTSRNRLILISILPFITMIMTWTNDLHGLVWQKAVINSDGMFIRTWGWWFWVHAVYSDGMSFISVFLAAWFWRSKAPLYGKQFKYLTFSVVFVMIVNAIYVLGVWRRIDLTTVAWGIASLFITWSLFRNGLFELVPIARNRIMESTVESIVVLDNKDRIVDMNPAAQQIFQCETTGNIGRDAGSFFAKWPNLQEMIFKEKAYAEIAVARDQPEHYYEACCSPLKNERDIVLGKMLTIRDITDKKLAEQELWQKQQEIAIQQERDRMARDLHDNLGQIMGFINVQAQAIRQYLDQDNVAKVDDCLSRLTEVAQEAHNNVRETILSMRGENYRIKPRDFFQEVDRQADLLVKSFGVRTEVDYTGAEGFILDNPETCRQVLNILKESMNNIIKHSGASAMKVVIEEKNDILWISVMDNGCGFDRNKAIASARRFHYGLRFMQERATELGGEIHIHSKPGQGTTVIIMIPKQSVKAPS